jgi:hypothetical protein
MTILIILFAIMVIYVSAYYVAEFYVKWERRQVRQEREYEKLYRTIQFDLWDNESSEVIRTNLNRLKSFKWQNKEKTNLLIKNWFDKFYKVESDPKLSVPEQIKEENKTRL